MTGWTSTKNWCTGNWRWEKPIVRNEWSAANTKDEANTEFFKYISKIMRNGWIPATVRCPSWAITLLQFKVLPLTSRKEHPCFLLIDNLRFDQWKAIQPIFCRKLPYYRRRFVLCHSANGPQYSRNAIFSGLLPIDIEKKFPSEWKNDNDEGGKNLHEEEFLAGTAETA